MAARKLRWRKDGLRNIPVEEACWQYLLDHCYSYNQNGFIGRFSIPNKDHFLQSLNARIGGKYRWTEEDVKLLTNNK